MQTWNSCLILFYAWQFLGAKRFPLHLDSLRDGCQSATFYAKCIAGARANPYRGQRIGDESPQTSGKHRVWFCGSATKSPLEYASSPSPSPSPEWVRLLALLARLDKKTSDNTDASGCERRRSDELARIPRSIAFFRGAFLWTSSILEIRVARAVASEARQSDAERGKARQSETTRRGEGPLRGQSEARRDVSCSYEIHTSAIKRPDPYGNLYFIRSHDFCTPVTRALAIARSRKTVGRDYACTWLRLLSHDSHIILRYIILNPYRESVIFELRMTLRLHRTSRDTLRHIA